MKNKQTDWLSGLNQLVFSSGGDHPHHEEEVEDKITEPASAHVLRIWLEKKGRGGKQATLIKGFLGDDLELKELSTLLKKHCGVGGSIKENDIIIQGDQRTKVRDFLISRGYSNTKLAGG
ncbi:MAG TPA: translation initiation factor [Saprospirales bacterium]|nr:translation initiation factor [Saprospirales bacterium]HRQ29606.1 translation initiation factor [Saprospiraceae bacterium]